MSVGQLVERRATAPPRALVPELRPPEPRVAWTFIYIAFLAYVFAITTFRLPIGEVSMIVALLGLALQRERLRSPAIFGWAVLFLSWCVLGYFRTPYQSAVWENVILFGKLCLIILVAANALRSPAQIRFFMIFVLGCYALFPVRGALINYFIGHSTLLGRAVWNYTYSNPNDLAALTLLMLSVAAALLATERTRWIRWCAITGLALLPVLILMTQSRGGFIALSMFAAFAIVGQRRTLRTALIVITLALGVVAVAPSGVWQRVRGLSEVTDNLDRVDPEGSAKARFQIWQVALKIIDDHPVTGVGWGAYPFAHAEYAPVSGVDPTVYGFRDTHSTVLNVLAETGVPGLVLFLALLWGAMRDAERARRMCVRVQPRLALQLRYLELGLLAFLVAGVFGSFAKLAILYLHLVLLWVVAQNAMRIARSSHPVDPRRLTPSV